MIDVLECVEFLRADRGDAIVVVGNVVGQAWRAGGRHDLDYYGGASMGDAPGVALGLALAQPQRPVLALLGDGAMLMGLASLVTIASQRPPNLTIHIFENGMHEMTGGQPIPGAGVVDFAAIARGAGFPVAAVFDDMEAFRAARPALMAQPGPRLLALKVAPCMERIPRVGLPTMAEMSQTFHQRLMERVRAR
jgi:thiamine pyrophosphate-dependent acetolactate synthase large subunit-like protein